MHFADYRDLGDESDEKTLVIENINLVPAQGCSFKFYDAFIDRICFLHGNGSFTLSDTNENVIITGGEFEVKESVVFNIDGDLCSNGLKDNREEGVDCGGVLCVPCVASNCPED